MNNEPKDKKWKVEFVGITELGIRDKIATHVIDAPSLPSVKRRIPKLAETLTDYPELTRLIKHLYRSTSIPLPHSGVPFLVDFLSFLAYIYTIRQN